MIEGPAACFAGLADPRETCRCDHRLTDILVIAVCAVAAGAESWEDIELYGRSKRAWLETFLALPSGIPSHDTFRRVFMLLDADAFEACCATWAPSLAAGVEREVAAVDGKTEGRSGSRRHAHGPLHLVSAWASGRGLALGQREVDGTSNEIAAIPELLEALRLDGGIVTLDAMGRRKEIAERIRAKGADSLLVLKAKHGRACEAVREPFERPCFGRGSGGRPVFDAFDEGHGRLVRRRVFVSPAEGSRALVRPARLEHGAGGGDDPRCQRHPQGRGRGPLLPHELRRRSRRPGPSHPPALERRERAALGPRPYLPRGRQSRARPHRRPQPRPPAQDRPQPRRRRPRRPSQPTRSAQNGGLERRLHAPDHRWPRSCVNPGERGRTGMAEAAGDVVRLPTARGDAEARRMGRTEAGQSRWWVRHPWGGEAFYGTAEQVTAHLRRRTAEREAAEADRQPSATGGPEWRA